MTMKLYAAGTKDRKLLMLGLASGFVATLLVTSFYFVDNHEWYWDIAPVIGALVVILAASGGVLIGHSLGRTQERRLWLVGLGGVLWFAWIASGTVAAALGFLGMNYLPDGYIGWASYSSQYIVGWVDVSLLQFATATGLLGGFCIGFGFAPKLRAAFETSTAISKKKSENQLQNP
jgi:hypothetical protein